LPGGKGVGVGGDFANYIRAAIPKIVGENLISTVTSEWRLPVEIAPLSFLLVDVTNVEVHKGYKLP
jgi:hypothetical protein